MRRTAPRPKIRDWQASLGATEGHGWTLACAHQCPWHAKAMQDLKATAAEGGQSLKVVELKTARAAQEAPSGFGAFALTEDGTLHADHYISATRFRSILKKTLKR